MLIGTKAWRNAEQTFEDSYNFGAESERGKGKRCTRRGQEVGHRRFIFHLKQGKGVITFAL